LGERLSVEELSEDVREDAAVADIIDFDGGIDSGVDDLVGDRAIEAMDDQSEIGEGLEVIVEAENVESF
jgi:hypothetical protein